MPIYGGTGGSSWGGKTRIAVVTVEPLFGQDKTVNSFSRRTLGGKTPRAHRRKLLTWESYSSVFPNHFHSNIFPKCKIEDSFKAE